MPANVALPKTLGERLRAWRNMLGKTQAEMVRATRIPLATWKKYEGDDREPGAAALAAMAVTGLNLHWLLTGTGSMLRTDASAGLPLPRGAAYATGGDSKKAPMVAEPRAAWTAGSGDGINVDVLAAIIRGLEDAERLGGGKMDPARKAALIAAAYSGTVPPDAA